jgi:hypothetical protein
MRTLFAVSGVLAWLFGLALLFAPAGFYAPTGLALTPLMATVAQAHGATLVGLGVVNWLARDADARGARAVLVGNLVIQVLALGVVLRTMALGAGRAVLPGVAIHVGLATWFAVVLARMPRHVPAA